MRLIIYQLGSSINANDGYAYSIQLSYILGFTTVSIGHSEYVYNFYDNAVTIVDISERLKTLRFLLKNRNLELVDEAESGFKYFKKLKNKSSQQIVASKQLENRINELFLFYIEDFYDQMSEKFGYKIMKEYINPDDFYIYELTKTDTSDFEQMELLPEDILQRLLPDQDKHSLFFLNTSLEFDYFHFVDSENNEAEQVHNFYGSNLLNFPNLSLMTSSEVALIREDLKIGSLKFREKINEWATICYDNPNSNLGLEYFRENLLPLQESADDLARQSPTLNSFSGYTNRKGRLSILFGEAPIDTIWKIYLDTETISQEIFDKLLEIKKEQAPKFDGRWPVAVIKAIEDKEVLEEENEDINSETAIKSVRKSISLD